MADQEEIKNTPDISEFEATLPAQPSNKDLWLFLIIIDVICLCVFGYFLYKNLSVQLLDTPPAARGVKVAETVVAEQVVTEPKQAAVAEPTVPLAEEMITETTVVQEPAPAVVTVEKMPSVISEEKAAAAEPAAPAEKKESVIVQSNAKSKYRQVTFRYFGQGKEVAIVSGFTMTKPRAMTKKNGVWETTLAILPGTYKYLFIVDGKQIPDPYAEQKDGRSVVVVK